MRVLVTGGAGFLGSHLCLRLAADGHAVTVVDSLVTSGEGNVEELQAAGITLVRGDVTTDILATGPFGELDAIAHLASPASPEDYARWPIETLRVGAEGTRHALDLAVRTGARFVLASTSEVYGEPLHHPQRETDPGRVDSIGPRSAYDEAKRYAEALTTAYAQTHSVNAGIARIFNTYGPRLRPYDGRVVPTFVRQALRGAPLTVHGDGLQTRSFCYVEDLVDGLVRLLASDQPGPVNLGNPDEIDMAGLAKLVRDLAGSDSPVVFATGRAGDPTVRQPDVTRAWTQLGWAPRTGLSEGLSHTIDWCRERFSS